MGVLMLKKGEPLLSRSIGVNISDPSAAKGSQARLQRPNPRLGLFDLKAASPSAHTFSTLATLLMFWCVI
jgi:hypothetical protein